MDVVYTDNNATTQVAAEVLEEMVPYFHDFYGQSYDVQGSRARHSR